MKMTWRNRDLISSLPDDVLCHILSFLPTKYSVRTKVLSTRWIYLFAYVPVLDFDYTDFIFCSLASENKFIDFVNRVLVLYNVPQMVKFRLHCERFMGPPPDNICLWISFVIYHNVRELDISILRVENKALPCELFSCKMLSTLKLSGNFHLKLPSSAWLPCLKTLHLVDLNFDSSAKRILSICPELEDLLLSSCNFINVDVLDVSHPTLRKLTLHYIECSSYWLVINAPNLLCFEFLKSVTRGICGETVLTSLVEARICPAFEDDLTKLVHVVSHAQHLYLSKHSIEDFPYFSRTLPTFCKLTRLEIGRVSRMVWGVLPDLLIKSSHLKVLVFAKGCNNGKSDDTDVICFENVPSCVSGNLKEIEFRNFSMQKNECKLVEYFLKNAQVLDKMKIQLAISLKEQLEFCKKLLTFSKFSRECQIVIDSD